MVSSVRYAQYLAPFSVLLVGVVMVFMLTVTTGETWMIIQCGEDHILCEGRAGV